MSDPQFWIAVASAEHVRRGRAQGFAQVCHGRRAPLARIRPGDGLVYYSPTERFGGKDRFQTFTALGFVRAGDPYLVDMGGGFRAFRRDIDWAETSETPIRPLLGELDFTARRDWGYRLRFGLFEVIERDFMRIRSAMSVRARPDRSFRCALAAGAL